ncbi:hypothetical protein C7S13_8493 [Burkholderia cepacia]|nr:hypothetical protein [Burkholderia cepacia]
MSGSKERWRGSSRIPPGRTRSRDPLGCRCMRNRRTVTQLHATPRESPSPAG